MTLDTVCAGCGQKYRLPAELAGRKAKCKACGHAMTIEAPVATAAPRPARPPLQSFGSASAPRARPPLQSFGAAPAAPSNAPGPIMEFEEVAEDDAPNDDPYGLDDAPALPPKMRPEPEDADDEDRAMPRARGAVPGKKKKGKRLTNTAGFSKRFAACFVDGIVFAPITIYLSFGAMMASANPGALTPEAAAQVQAKLASNQLLANVLMTIYFAAMEASPLGASLGKLAVGLRVVDTDGRPSPPRAVLRAVLRGVSSVLVIPWLISAFTVAFSGRNQALHDMFSGSMVAEKR